MNSNWASSGNFGWDLCNCMFHSWLKWEVKNRCFSCAWNDNPSSCNLQINNWIKKLYVCSNSLLRIVPQAQLVALNLGIVTSSNYEKDVTLEIRLTESKSTRNAFSAHFELAWACFVQSKSIVSAHYKMAAIVYKVKRESLNLWRGVYTLNIWLLII